MSDLHETILSRVPPEARPTFSRLLAGTRRGVATLRQAITDYVTAIELAARAHKHLDRELCRAVAAASRHLLDAHPGASAPQQQLIIAAVEYFLLPRDADDDLAYESGFEDDAAVVNVVLREVGGEDHCVPGY